MKKLVAFLVLACAALTLVACGGGSDSSSSTEATSGSENSAGAGGAAKEENGGKAASVLTFEADPNGELAYSTTKATANAGEVEVQFDNPQALTHDVAIENSNGEEVGATELIASGSDSTTVNLKPGTYTYFCTVPGHREAGMEGTLTVK
jgi:plastocyanin